MKTTDRRERIVNPLQREKERGETGVDDDDDYGGGDVDDGDDDGDDDDAGD